MDYVEYNNKNIYKAKLLPIVFIFTMMFSFEISGVNMRYVVLAMWFIFCMFWSKRMVIKSEIIIIPLAIFLLLGYALLISTLAGNNNNFEYMRLLRCILTYVIILMFLSSHKYTLEEIISSLLFVLAIHAITIILGVIYPPFKEIILPISQYNKELLRFRSSGLLSGFDDAGMFCNFGMILDYTIRRQKGKGIGLFTIIFTVSAALSSRFNMAAMMLMLIVIIYLESKNSKIISKILVLILAVFAGGFAIVFWILTTNISPSLRSSLLSSYPALNIFYTSMLGSYTDYGIYTTVLSRHWSPMPISTFEKIFGMGVRITNSDIGYVKSMYSYGIVGIVWVLNVYIFSLVRIRRLYATSEKYISFIYLMCLTLMAIMETKTAIFLSSTSFEMISLLYISFILEKNNNRSL